MKAITFDRYGLPDVLRLQELPDPVPGPGEVLVANRASIATPPDCAFRSGSPFIVRFFSGLTRPKQPVPGTDFAGVVEAVGPGVTRFAPGDQIFGVCDGLGGAYAEKLVVSEAGVVSHMPDGVDFGEAAGLCEGFLTAMPFLRDEARLRPDMHILINGASGNIGHIAVQLAKDMGARVTAVCSTRNIEMVRQLGADAVIDYTQADFTADRAAYDVVFDAVGRSSFAPCRASLVQGGLYLTTVPSGAIFLNMLRGRFGRRGDGKRAWLATTGLRSAADKTRDLELLCEMIAAQRLRLVIGQRMSLAEAAAAHALVETGRKVGSLVLDIDG